MRSGFLTFGLAVLALIPAVGPGAESESGDAQATAKLFLSPVPPVLGGPARERKPAPAIGMPAPAALAPYVNEAFYIPLSARFANREVGDDLDYRLETYRASKEALLAELRAHLDTLRSKATAARQEELAALAREQTPRIAELEKEADRIRADLCSDGSGRRELLVWQKCLGARPIPAADIQARRAEILTVAAAYSLGLSPAQRRLLLGYAAGLAAGASNRSILAFSPEPSLILLPADLPPRLQDAIRAYRKERSELCRQTIIAIFGSEKGRLSLIDPATMQTLAERQAPALAALENQAESIRVGLAAISDPIERPAAPEMPKDLADQIAAYRAEKLDLQQSLLAEVEKAKARSSGLAPDESGRIIRDTIAKFMKENSDRYEALARNGDQIRTQVARLEGDHPASGTGELVAQFSRSVSRLQNYWDSREYREAALLPGLSPEQRRLLLAGAMQKMALPLPSAPP